MAAECTRRRLMARSWSVVLGAWGVLSGLAPHVLHHVGPLAGAALLAGAGGQLLFAGIALVVSLPLLLRIYRRFQTWMAPLIALAIMAGMFAVSTFVIGPAISGDQAPASPPGIEQPGDQGDHDDHGHDDPADQ